jgi:hypothetical protein
VLVTNALQRRQYEAARRFRVASLLEQLETTSARALRAENQLDAMLSILAERGQLPEVLAKLRATEGA